MIAQGLVAGSLTTYCTLKVRWLEEPLDPRAWGGFLVRAKWHICDVFSHTVFTFKKRRSRIGCRTRWRTASFANI